jgi:hypothetical protein
MVRGSGAYTNCPGWGDGGARLSPGPRVLKESLSSQGSPSAATQPEQPTRRVRVRPFPLPPQVPEAFCSANPERGKVRGDGATGDNGAGWPCGLRSAHPGTRKARLRPRFESEIVAVGYPAGTFALVETDS